MSLNIGSPDFISIFRISLSVSVGAVRCPIFMSFASAPQVSRLRPRSIPRTTFCATFSGGVEKYFIIDRSGIFSVCARNIPVMLNPGQTVNTLTLPSSSAVNASEKLLNAALLALYAAAPATGQSADELEMFTIIGSRECFSFGIMCRIAVTAER